MVGAVHDGAEGRASSWRCALTGAGRCRRRKQREFAAVLEGAAHYHSVDLEGLGTEDHGVDAVALLLWG